MRGTGRAPYSSRGLSSPVSWTTGTQSTRLSKGGYTEISTPAATRGPWALWFAHQRAVAGADPGLALPQAYDFRMLGVAEAT